MNDVLFEALGFILLPDGTIHYFGKALDLITKEEIYDPYLWQRCSHEEAIRKIIRNEQVAISNDISYIPGFYQLLGQLIEQHHVIFLNRSKKSMVQNATIYTNINMTRKQYTELLNYCDLCNACNSMTISYLEDNQMIEQNYVQNLEMFLDEFINIEYENENKK